MSLFTVAVLQKWGGKKWKSHNCHGFEFCCADLTKELGYLNWRMSQLKSQVFECCVSERGIRARFADNWGFRDLLAYDLILTDGYLSKSRVSLK